MAGLSALAAHQPVDARRDLSRTSPGRGGRRCRGRSSRVSRAICSRSTFDPPVTRIAPDALPRYRRAIDEQRLLDPAIYGTPPHIDSLRRVLSRSLQLALVTVAVILPESGFARERFSPLADAPFQAVLREFAGSGLTVIDDRPAMPDDSFDADFHLLPAPARTYSADFIRRVRPFSNAGRLPVDESCWQANPTRSS